MEPAIARQVPRVISEGVEVAEHQSDAVKGRGKLLFIGSFVAPPARTTDTFVALCLREEKTPVGGTPSKTESRSLFR